MISLSKNELQKILAEIFGILGLSKEEIDKTVYNFQKRIAFELVESVKEELPSKYQEFINKDAKDIANPITDPNHPMVAAIKKELERLHTKKEYLEKGKVILKRLIRDYVAYMSQGLSAEIAYKLKKALDALDNF